MGIFSTPLSTFGQTPRVLSGTVHVHLSEEVLALIIWHLPFAEKQRLRAVSPTFLQNALQARYGACLLVGEPPTSESEKLRPHDAKHARLFAHMRRLRDPFIVPLVREAMLCPPHYRTQSSSEAVEMQVEVGQTLLALVNVSKLMVEWTRPGDWMEPSQALGASWPATTPRLTHLSLHMSGSSMAELVALGPSAAPLQELSLAITGHILSDSLPALVSALIAPAQDSLVSLKVDFSYSPIGMKDPMTMLRFHAGVPQMHPFYDTLAALRMPNLRELAVASPFNESPSGCEESGLVFFISAHPALETLCVVPCLTAPPEDRPGPHYVAASGYTPFMELALAEVDWRRSRISALGLCARAAWEAPGDGVLARIASMVSLLPASLEELRIDIDDLSESHFTTFVGSALGRLDGVRTLHLNVHALTPSLLRLIVKHLPRLRILKLSTTRVARLTAHKSQIDPVVSACAAAVLAACRRSAVPHRPAPGPMPPIEAYLRATIPSLSAVPVTLCEDESRWEALDMVPFHSSLETRLRVVRQASSDACTLM